MLLQISNKYLSFLNVFQCACIVSISYSPEIRRFSGSYCIQSAELVNYFNVKILLVFIIIIVHEVISSGPQNCERKVKNNGISETIATRSHLMHGTKVHFII